MGKRNLQRERRSCGGFLPRAGVDPGRGWDLTASFAFDGYREHETGAPLPAQDFRQVRPANADLLGKCRSALSGL